MFILYKAKDKETKEWIKGNHINMITSGDKNDYILHHYIFNNDNLTITKNELDVLNIPIGKFIREIDKNTLCRSTNKVDNQDEIIYENDIILDTEEDDLCVVRWDSNNSKFVIDIYGIKGCLMEYGFDETVGDYEVVDTIDLCDIDCFNIFKIVGNIFDDKNLLQERGLK